MRPNQSTLAVALRTDEHSAAAIAAGADFETRWAAWRAGGFAHERAVRRRLTLIAGVAGALATVGAIAYTLLRP